MTKKFVRYRAEADTSFGILDGETIHQIEGGLFGAHAPTGEKHRLSEVKLLYPCTPGKILAVGLNYRSHLGERKAPEHPEMFYKPISALQNPGDPIATPRESINMHFEGELVVVVGQGNSVFGVTCGNDVSERDWQNGPSKDLQWWRAKGSDTFAPLGPAVVTGLDHGNLMLETRLNGKTVQKQSTSDLLFDAATVIKRISAWVTLEPGDLIYTGTPGSTSKLNPGDVVEVEIEGIGVLKNPVV
ncbi:MAG: fumarylacetoacetate hydrolase [Bryobacterales bacterium]|nr:fumarylacetoacetate hydrolase [Bryobacterales bacterium]